MRFYCGLHQPSDAHRFARWCIHVNRLQTRRKPLGEGAGLLDSQAFTLVTKLGGYPDPPAAYVEQINAVAAIARLDAAVAQDYMCEPPALAATGLTIADHQALTIERYDQLLAARPRAPILPVLQGYAPSEYVAHLRAYGRRLGHGAWVGVGSVCKRNVAPAAIVAVLSAILRERPDLRLHGFGVKITALRDPRVRALLWSADSLAWSTDARWRKLKTGEGFSQNDWRAAADYAAKIDSGAELAPPSAQLALAL